MTTSFPVTKTGLGLAAASLFALALLAAPVRAEDKVLAYLCRGIIDRQ